MERVKEFQFFLDVVGHNYGTATFVESTFRAAPCLDYRASTARTAITPTPPLALWN